jgi:hypothetical protein
VVCCQALFSACLEEDAALTREEGTERDIDLQPLPYIGTLHLNSTHDAGGHGDFRRVRALRCYGP